MGWLAKRHTQHARTSGGNNFRVRLLEELHCHTPTHEQLLHEGRAGIAIRAVTDIISKVTSYRGTIVNFTITHLPMPPCFYAVLKTFSSRFTERFLQPPSSRRLFASLILSSTADFSTSSPLSLFRARAPNYFHQRGLSF